jgi:hypothetical protein
MTDVPTYAKTEDTPKVVAKIVKRFATGIYV